MDKRLEKYPTTEMYCIKDTIGVPHSYCITPKHVAWAADHFSGLLGKEAIEDAEKHGARCDICKGKLKFAQHKTALLVAVRFDGELKDAPKLTEYLLECKPLCEADSFAGFAFVKDKR